MRLRAFCQRMNDSTRRTGSLPTRFSVFVAKCAWVLIMTSACLPSPAPAQIPSEDHDWTVPPTSQLRQPPYSAPTPLVIPGGLRITTPELSAMLEVPPLPILIDVASGNEHVTLQGAYWLPGAGRGLNFIDDVQGSLSRFLEQVTEGNRNRALVFFCVNLECWLSYNAALRAVSAGYTTVYWYRGGLVAWQSGGRRLVPMHQPGR